MNQKPLTLTLLACLLCLTFWIRIQGVERLPDGQFTENDAYFYHSLANIIAEHGELPARDMDRWLPLGRDNTQLLSLYAYAIAYTHKLFPWWSLYQIQLYLPIICFCLGLGGLFLLITRSHGLIFAAIFGLLLATLPGSIERSSAGFGDRDAWCWMLGTLAVTSYLWKEQMTPGGCRWIVTALAGFIVFLGGLSWEAFGLFVLIILTVELYKFCTTDTEEHLSEYSLWLLMFVPGLYLMSPAYHSGYSFTTHLAALTLLPPLVVFALRGVRYLLLHFYEPLHAHPRKLAGGLALLGIAAGASYIAYQHSTFASTAFTLFETPLMKNVGELADPHFRFWHRRYGAIFIFGSLGWIAASLHLWKGNGLPLALAISLFTATTFFREPLSDWIGDSPCDTLFGISLGMIIVSLAIVAFRKELPRNGIVTLAVLAWFLLWCSFARGGKRYDFFIGLSLAYGTAWILYLSPAHLIQSLKNSQRLSPHLNESRITAIIVIAVLIPVLFLNFLGGHLNRAGYAAAEMRKPVPGHGTPIQQMLTWMKKTLPENTVVAANWGYGNHLNALGGVKTITDPDHFLPHWIHLYYRHVFCAQNTREALEFLKTHKATHLMLTKLGVISRARDYSIVGSINKDRAFTYIPLLLLSDQRLSRIKETPFLYIEPIDITAPPNSLTAHLKNGEAAQLPYVTVEDAQHTVYNQTSDADTQHGGVLLSYDAYQRLQKADYLPPLGWNSLAIRLYFRNELPDIFIPVYSTHGNDAEEFKVWEIHYPPDIKADPKYLKTGIRDIDDTLHLQ